MSLAEMFYQESGGRTPAQVLQDESNKLRAERDAARAEVERLKRNLSDAVGGVCFPFGAGQECGVSGAYCSEACRLRAEVERLRKALHFASDRIDRYSIATAGDGSGYGEVLEAIALALAPKEKP